jgi:hypothetical protein
VNREQSCTVRTFDAKNGTFIAKLAGIRIYRDCFVDLLANAIELSVPYQPNPGPQLQGSAATDWK